MKLISFGVLLTISTIAQSEEALEEEFQGPVRICKKGPDEQVNGCFRRILADLKPRLAAGIPEIGLQPLDPFHIGKLHFSQGQGALVIKATFTNITVRHLSEFRNAEFKINSKEKRLYFNLDIPRLRLDGTYNLAGNVFIFPLGGIGPYWFEIGGVNAKGFGSLKVVQEKNDTVKFAQLENVHLDFSIKEIKVQLLNLFNGNEVLGPVINNVLNENAQELFAEMKPEIVAVVKNIIVSIANGIVKNMPFLAEIVE